MPTLRWSDADEIGYQLGEEYPDTDPLTVNFVDLRARVLKLDEFDDAGDSTEPILEAIQMAWLGYYRESH